MGIESAHREPEILAPFRESATVLRASQASSEGGLPSVAGRLKRDEILRVRRRSNIILADTTELYPG